MGFTHRNTAMHVSRTSQLGIVCTGCTIQVLLGPASHLVAPQTHSVSTDAHRLAIGTSPQYTDPEDPWPESGQSLASQGERLHTALHRKTTLRPAGVQAWFVANGRYLYMSTPKHDPPAPPRA